MALQIESGAGNRQTMTVTDDGYANVNAKVRTRIADRALEAGKAYIWQSLTYNYDAGDTILLVKNTSTTEDLVIHSISFSGDTTSLWHVQLPTSEVTVTGTTVTGRNLNTASTVAASATAAADETGNSQGNIIYSQHVLANTPHKVGEEVLGGALRLTSLQSVGVDVVTDGGAAVCTIVGYYETSSRTTS